MKTKHILSITTLLACTHFAHAQNVDYNIPINIPAWDCYPFSGDFHWSQSWNTLSASTVIGNPNTGSDDGVSLRYSNGNSGYLYQILDITIESTYQGFQLAWYAASIQKPGLQQEVILFYTDKDASFNGTIGTGIDTDITNNALLSYNGAILQYNPEDGSDSDAWASYSLEGLADGALFEGKHLGIAMRATFPDGSASYACFDSFILNAGTAIPESSSYAFISGITALSLITLHRRRK